MKLFPGFSHKFYFSNTHFTYPHMQRAQLRRFFMSRTFINLALWYCPFELVYTRALLENGHRRACLLAAH